MKKIIYKLVNIEKNGENGYKFIKKNDICMYIKL